jgi:hypothetical protein
MPSTRKLERERQSGISRVQAKSEVISTGFTASAAPVTVVPDAAARAKEKTLRVESWQRQSWAMFDVIGEYRYGCEWVGNQLAKAKLFVSEGGKPTENTTALDLLKGFFGGVEGQQQMLRNAGINITAAGEVYIAGTRVGGEDVWETAASTQINRNSFGLRINEVDRENPFCLRVWRPHPERVNEPDAAARSMLGNLDIIRGLGEHEIAQINSRLAGAGLLLLPNEISFQTTEITDSSGQNAFSALLADTMAQAVRDPGSSAALVPVMLSGPGEHLDKIRHVTFWSPLDEKAAEMQEAAMSRLARSMDMPPEILTGTGDMNHWGAWQMDEASIKSHTQPLLDVITHALTTGFLRPMLAAAGVPNPENFTISADTSEMRLRPNRSKEATELYDRGELGGDVLRRENGFSEDDGLDDDELEKWLLKKLAAGSPSPEQLQGALEALGISLRVPPPAAMVVEERVREAQPPRSLEEHPAQDPPEEPVAASVVASAEMHVLRALERAGNRIKSARDLKLVDVAAVDIYQHVAIGATEADSVLEDGFSLLNRSSFACNGPALHAYTRQLLLTREKPSVEGITAALRGA